MNGKTWASTIVAFLVVAVGGSILITSAVAEAGRREESTSKVLKWAEKLDGMTTENGTYERWEGEELPEVDAWGNNLRVSYSQGGVMEFVSVRSIGKDGKSHTKDDLVDTRQATNLKGIGNGIRNNIEETAESGAKGTLRGALVGLKEGLDETGLKIGGVTNE